MNSIVTIRKRTVQRGFLHITSACHTQRDMRDSVLDPLSLSVRFIWLSWPLRTTFSEVYAILTKLSTKHRLFYALQNRELGRSRDTTLDHSSLVSQLFVRTSLQRSKALALFLIITQPGSLNNTDVTRKNAQIASCLKESDFIKVLETVKAAFDDQPRRTRSGKGVYDTLVKKYPLASGHDLLNEWTAAVKRSLMQSDEESGSNYSGGSDLENAIFFWVYTAATVSHSFILETIFHGHLGQGACRKARLCSRTLYIRKVIYQLTQQDQRLLYICEEPYQERCVGTTLPSQSGCHFNPPSYPKTTLTCPPLSRLTKQT